MAENNSAPTTNTLTPRQRVGQAATHQVEALLRSLLHSAHHAEYDELPCLLQAALPRLLELNSISMSAHDDGCESVADMTDRLHGGYGKIAQAVK